MDAVFRISIYLVIGLALLSVNLWFVQAVHHAIVGADVVIAPFEIVGGNNDKLTLGRGLTHMLLARLRKIERDLEAAQASLMKSGTIAGAVSVKVGEIEIRSEVVRELPQIALFPISSPKTASIDAQLFEPLRVNIKVGGVEFGGILSSVQRWLLKDRILAFSVYQKESSAIVAGSLDALGFSEGDALWIEVENNTPEAIAEETAYAIVHKKLAKDRRELAVLDLKDFKTLLGTVSKAAELNRKVTTLQVSARDEFAEILPDVEYLASKMEKWDPLIHLAATIAESAENEERALYYYEKLAHSSDAKISEAAWLTSKLEDLRPKPKTALPPTTDEALEKIGEDAAYAVDFLNQLFGYDLAVPDIQLLVDTMRNAYWDGDKIHVPPQIRYLPDVTYHEASWPFVQRAWSFEYQGQSGALAQSYTDVLTSLIKQNRLSQTAASADWLIAPGAVAWLEGTDIPSSLEKSALRSLKAPGTAYDDDPQVAQFELSTETSDFGGVHINSGIPNKAFYETAIRIGSEKAGRIWREALQRFSPSANFLEAVRVTHDTAVSIYGKDSPEQDAVTKAWDSVGLSVEMSNADESR